MKRLKRPLSLWMPITLSTNFQKDMMLQFLNEVQVFQPDSANF